ncbi:MULTISPECIES: ribonuclease E activity regulator RraA [unclassified Microbacterium]|uniref:ribonuclease E activity regulator RraA n=1 Tax=unclassified Microbacterium TaxID=2609290 RepID=UPI0034657544
MTDAKTPPRTTDLADDLGDAVQSCDLQFRDFGGRTRFAGLIATFRSPEDNLVLKEILSEPGDGRVIVVDAGGLLRGAMIGDNMAERAATNGWAGIVINGVVRDSAALASIPIGIKALGTNPRRSKKNGEGERDVELEFGGIRFRPGDRLTADEDGIVVRPPITI